MELVQVSVICTVIASFISTVGCIKDGHIALPFQFPYHAFIQVFNSTAQIGDCSGAVISSTFIISIYDCLWEGKKFRVKLGSLYPGGLFDIPSYNEMTEILPHHYPVHSFNEKYPSLLKLETEITFGLNIQPVKLPKPFNTSSSDDGNVSSANYDAFATGYGKADTKRLEYLKMIVVPISECRGHFTENLLEKPLCVRSEDIFGNDAGTLCTEEGVPLVLKENRTLIGMFGITDAQCTIGGPNLFIQIDRFVDWIDETMKAFADETKQ